jgi:cbb3-type cytochrome oxidase subunit 3
MRQIPSWTSDLAINEPHLTPVVKVVLVTVAAFSVVVALVALVGWAFWLRKREEQKQMARLPLSAKNELA